VSADERAEARPQPASARALARARMRASLARSWRLFRGQREGMIGLIVLVFFVLLALTAPLYIHPDLFNVAKATGPSMSPPSLEFPLGTDENGLSLLPQVIWGSRVSLLVGFAATLISMAIGTAAGIASGHYHGWGGATIERLTDWFLVIPFLPLVIVLATVLGRSLLNVIIVIGITSWPGTARLVRAQTLTAETRPYVERARALGGGDWHVMTRHVLPNVMPLVMANTVLTVAIAILSETTLSFLGLGVPFAISWGSLIEGAFAHGAISAGAWWYLLPPGICVILVVLAFTLVGRALESVLNPRLRER
jgi:peptide/nickel transport system permease protein